MTKDQITKIAYFNFFSHKKLVFELTKVYGLRIVSAQKLLIHLGIDRNIKVKDLPQDAFKRLEEILSAQEVPLPDGTHSIHTNLKTTVKLNINGYKKMNPAFYIASRWKFGLAVHGQRTRSTGRRNKKLVLATRK